MKMKWCLVVLLSVCFLCGAYTGTAQASNWGNVLGDIFGCAGTSSDNQTVTVVGKIVDEEQVPLSGIKVVIQSGKGGSWSTYTDADGNYRLNVLGRKSSFFLTVTGEGWRTVRDRVSLYERERVLNLKLHHDYVTGKVTDRAGNPLPRAKVSFEADGGTKGVTTVESDENGNYKATIPADGMYYWVIVSQDGYQTCRKKEWLKGGLCERLYVVGRGMICVKSRR